MSALVEMLLVAAARELVQTRPVLIFWGVGVYNAAARVACADKERRHG